MFQSVIHGLSHHGTLAIYGSRPCMAYSNRSRALSSDSSELLERYVSPGTIRLLASLQSSMM